MTRVRESMGRQLEKALSIRRSGDDAPSTSDPGPIYGLTGFQPAC
jgi:hypothetical protein